MAWATMHFATGMCCGGAAAGIGCLLLRRGWRWIPAAMTAGGLWAMVPDMPRIFREDFPNAPLAAILGNRRFEAWLNQWGDLFCFHRQLDDQPHAYALAGMTIIIVLYNAALLWMWWLGRSQHHTVSVSAIDDTDKHKSIRKQLKAA